MTGPAVNAGLVLFMASETPAHFDFTRPFNAYHRSYIPVAIAANSTRADVHHMRKVNEVWHPIDPDPGNRFLIFPVGHEFFNFRRILSNEEVAGPAIGNGWYAGDCRLRRVAVTEEAWDCVITGVNLVTESYRLDWRTVPEIERQNIHERKDGQKNNTCCDKAFDKPR
jgi:hypothetical protein